MTVLSTYAEIHAFIIGAFSGLVAYLLATSESNHIRDTRREVAYYAGGFMAAFMSIKMLEAYLKTKETV